MIQSDATLWFAKSVTLKYLLFTNHTDSFQAKQLHPIYDLCVLFLQPLLTDVSHRTKALLGISAMVHKICDDTPNCDSEPEIADFISILNSNIGSDCSSSTPEERELIHVTLKALGNAGDAVTSSAVIGRCITNQNLDTERRVIALQAFRRVPCSVHVSSLY